MTTKSSAWTQVLERLDADLQTVRLGGGVKAIERQHAKNRLTARERVAALIDPGSPFDELMTFAGWDMYPEAGGCPSGGVVTGIGQVAGRPWMIIANDATVKAGAFFPITAKKVIRAQTYGPREPRCRWSTSWTPPGCTCPCKTRCFPTRTTSGGCST